MVLSVDDLPSHNHGVYDPGHNHSWSGSRQLAGTDGNNNSSDFSKGDRSTQDTVTKVTTTAGTGIGINATGGSRAHNNMPPYYVLIYIMKV